MTKPVVSIIMGSDSDLPTMEESKKVFDDFGIESEMMISSAHRTPDKTAEYAKAAAGKGIKVIIAAAGYSAHLAGVIAAYTVLPVIGVPLAGSPLQGFDALLAMGQMPSGIPVATMTLGKAGAKNAALFAISILAVSDQSLFKKLNDYRAKMAKEVEEKDKKIKR